MLADRFRLRSFVESLPEHELTIIREPVDLIDVAALVDGDPKAVVFTRVGPTGDSLAANVAGGRGRLAHAFSTTRNQLLKEVLRRLAGTGEVEEVDTRSAPTHEVVQTGEDVDLLALPIHLQHSLDGGLFISSAMDVSVDAATGQSNVGIRRLMLHSRNQTGIGLFSPSDLKVIYENAAGRGAHLPVAFVVGSHPIDHIAATMRTPGDELKLMAALRGARMQLVKCVTSDIRVPADAEYVIEGYLDSAGHIYPEGPFGEFLGYYGGVKRNPRFQVTAITRRHDAMFQTSTIAGSHMTMTDTAQLNSLRSETVLWRALETSVRGVLDVHATAASGGMFNVRIALRQNSQGESRNAIAAAFGCLANVKNVFVVDDDVDIFSNDSMDWALATRFQPHRDLVIQSGFRAIPLDPSLDGDKTGSKAGFDLTKRGIHRGSVEEVVPQTPSFDHRRFPSISEALQDGPKTFEQLIGAIGTRDGREVVLHLHDLQERGLAKLMDSGLWAIC